MTEPQNRIHDLLRRVRALNDSNPDHGEQRVQAPEPGSDRIATLRPGVSRPLSPMLAARFRFAGAWGNARLSQNWLSLSEIERALNDDRIKRSIELRTENSYGDDPPGGVAPEDCAIFGHNPFELDETYLVWKEGQEEPIVWEYFDADDSVFSNLERYLEYIVGDRAEDDKERTYAVWVRVISSLENELLQVAAIKVGDDLFRIDSRIDGESFTTESQDGPRAALEFVEGDVVRCEERRLSDVESGLLAVEKVGA